MIDAKVLLADLQKLLTKLEDDIRRRCDSQPEVDKPLQAQYAAAKSANRTAQAYPVWRDEQITQAAVAWILGCVFVRFCEDNHLIDPPRLSGPGECRRRAEDEHTLYFRSHPKHSDREYLQWVFEQVAQLPAMKELFDKRHNPLWALGVSGDGAMLLREFWLKRDAATGDLVHDFTHPAFVAGVQVPPELEAEARREPTRFLGDLYQDLSESARKKYALLQTPNFVEEFILDRTLTPAIREFGYQQVRMIDPTCGSGHFLLGGFHRLFDLWVEHEPKTNVRELAQRALNGVYGVDLNPFAIAIARFRLLVAAVHVCDIRSLADAPGFTIHLAAGDSLLHGPRIDVSDDADGGKGASGRQLYLGGVRAPHADDATGTGGRQLRLADSNTATAAEPFADPLAHVYDTEDAALLRKYLGQQYHAVVGNPPYVTVKDKATNDAYRERFAACHRQYSLAVPFFQRFFDLALSSTNGDAGFVGQITANSFMKREFGKKLIEDFLPRWDLSHMIDTSGAYVPGHGTPTVILFGRNRPPTSSTIRAVMGIRGEPSTPADPAKGLVWSAILAQTDVVGSESQFVSVTDAPRANFHRHPWSIGGGGAAELKEYLDEEAKVTLGGVVESIGFYQDTHADEAFVHPPGFVRRRKLGFAFRPQVRGDDVRDWGEQAVEWILFPYDDRIVQWSDIPRTPEWAWFYDLKVTLRSRSTFGGGTYQSDLRPWFDFHQFPKDRARASRLLAFGFVATHNHFVLDRGGKVFNRSAPVIKLPADASEDDHLGLLGLLNSSLACFWMKQVFHNKGSSVDQHGARQRTAPFEDFWEYDGTKLKQFPMPSNFPVALAKMLDQCATFYAVNLPNNVCRHSIPEGAILGEAWQFAEGYLGEMIAMQEELDWECYRLYGLLPDAPCHEKPPRLYCGQRAFEIVLARKIAAGEAQTTWFERHGSTPITEIPAEWPEDYKKAVRRRIEIIESDKNIALIERPEYKRRWNTEPWEEMQKNALRSWLLDRLEGWPLKEVDGGPRSLAWDEREPRLMSVGQLADRVRQHKDFMQVAALYRGREDFDVTKLVAELVQDEAVPLLPVLRYKESGLRNRQVWEQVWEMQRQEDAIDARTKLPPTDPKYLTEAQAKAEKKAKIGDIPVPPKYKSADMLPGPIWRLRGKLDVPKERFVSFPHCQRDADSTPVITWAGFDHLQQLEAVAGYYMDMKEREGWAAERRVPLLAGMLELLPWVLQWHNDLDPVHQLKMGDYYRDFISDEAREMGKTVEQIRAWRPFKGSPNRRRTNGN